MEELVYKVLWVDDEPQNVDGLRINASKRNIQSLSYDNWEEAFEVLQHEWPEITAIILDANCRLYKSDTGPNQNFLSKVFAQLNQFFGNIHRYIPWYVLSEGTMDNYSIIMDYVRESHNSKEWGKSDFKKAEILAKDNELFDNICSLGKKQSNNIVLYRHREVFKYLGAESLISNDARKIMLKALAVLYYPDENINYEFAGNPLRKVLEYMFRSANKQGLLPDEFFDKNGNPVLWDSMQYMSGLEPSNIKFRYGAEGEAIFPKRQNHLMLNILNFVNEDSHTSKDDDAPYIIDKESQDLFFGFLFQLLHVIKFYGQFVEAHPDVVANKAKMQKIITAADLVVGKEGIVLAGPRFNYMGTTVLPNKLGCRPRQKIRIDEAVLNTGSDKDKYPTYATKVTIL